MIGQPTSMYPEGTSTRRVIDYATAQFYARGIKNVTMDGIAQGLQMSKRTLYQLFADKEQLVIACIAAMSEQDRQLVHRLINDNHNALEAILWLIENNIARTKKTSTSYIEDLRRYKTVREYIQAAQEQSIDGLVEIFALGVKQGLFLSQANIRLIMKSMQILMNTIPTTDILHTYSIQQCFVNIGLYHLRGCCTSKGIALIDNFLAHYLQDSKTT